MFFEFWILLGYTYFLTQLVQLLLKYFSFRRKYLIISFFSWFVFLFQDDRRIDKKGVNFLDHWRDHALHRRLKAHLDIKKIKQQQILFSGLQNLQPIQLTNTLDKDHVF